MARTALAAIHTTARSVGVIAAATPEKAPSEVGAATAAAVVMGPADAVRVGVTGHGPGLCATVPTSAAVGRATAALPCR